MSFVGSTFYSKHATGIRWCLYVVLDCRIDKMMGMINFFVLFFKILAFYHML